jgi:acyl-[acyl-carrier protein] desaturase
MSASPSLRERLHRNYLDFFETAERKRRWSVFDDIPWDKLDAAHNSEPGAIGIETYCAEEMYLPDYTAGGIELTRSMFGTAWFQACWSYEESKHALVFREYLSRSGLRTEARLQALEDDVFSRQWKLPFKTRRQMACYGALQESATYLAYRTQREKAQLAGNVVLEAIFANVSRDEAAHAGFYRAVVEGELAEDREGTISDLASVIAAFKMPGDGLIPCYQERLKVSGAGISTRTFVQRCLLPALKSFGTNRAELKLAILKNAETPPSNVSSKESSPTAVIELGE